MGSMLLKNANLFYKQGNFTRALLLYNQLVDNHPYFAAIVSLNIHLCENKLKKYSTYLYDRTNHYVRITDQNIVFEDYISINNWKNWNILNNVMQDIDGVLRCEKLGSFECAHKLDINVQQDAYYNLEFTYQLKSISAEFYWIIRKSGTSSKINYYDDNQAPIIYHKFFSGDSKRGSISFRTFCDVSRIDLHLFVKKACKDDEVKFNKIKLNCIEPEEACKRPSIIPNEKIIASLASIPQRENILKNVVRSLYHQVDEIRIFMNGYKNIPTFLQKDTKITCEQSQIWGDNGDAGKFFWTDDPTPGYRFICDDDIIYPIDYVYKMIQKIQEYDNKVIVGLHGILLKQPVNDYYGSNQRSVCHCKSEKQLDYSCHVLGTGAIAYHHGSITMSRNDFHYPNMGDIWLAQVAQNQKVPLVCITSPENWVMPQPQVVEHSIYNHSCSSQSSGLNTANVQTSVVRSLHPLTILQRNKNRLKVIFSIKTYNRKDYLKECIDSFLATRSLDFDWVVIIADDGSKDSTLDYLDNLVMQHELHIIKNNRRYAVGQSNSIFKLAAQVGYDFGFQVDDDILFLKSGWDDLYINAAIKSGYDHLCFLHQKHFFELRKKENDSFIMPYPIYDQSETCESYTNVHKCMGALFTFTSKMLNSIGSADESNFPIRGQWHIDLSIRACRAGSNNQETFFDAKNSNSYIILQNNKQNENYRCSIPWSDEYKITKEASEIQRRLAVIQEENRIFVSPPKTMDTNKLGKNINSFFDKIYVINLDRRPDRLKRLQINAHKLGINFHRFPAFDGKLFPYLEQYQTYSKQEFFQVSDKFSINSNFEFYRKYPSDLSRVAYFENKNQRKAIGSPGAWGYLLTMISILEDALKSEYEQILVIDDDVIFHKQTNDLFSKIIDQVPENWQILQLGALQYNWDEKWIDWYSDNLYMCNGCSLGSHAVGLRRSIIPLVLNLCKRFDLPYDEGPLHKPKALYPHKCLTFYPNLIIQDVSESDISDNTGQKKAMSRKDNIYRWDMDDYPL